MLASKLGLCRWALATATAAGLAGCLLARPAAAADCESRSGLTACIDADPLWIPASPSRFIAVPSAGREPRALVSSGVALGYASRPIVVVAPSPATEGRELVLLDEVLTLTSLWALSPADGLSLGVAWPATLHQSGAGIEALTSQTGGELPATALRDPRVEGAYAFWHPRGSQPWQLTLASRLAVSLPFGQKDRFAGNGGCSAEPSFVASVARGPVFTSGQLGWRVRAPAELGGARLGTALVTALGIGSDLLPQGLLSIALETFMHLSLIQQVRTQSGPAREDAALAPAEWMASVRTNLPALGLRLALGAGTGIPLSSERRPGEATQHFAAVTTPELRAVAVVRYVPAAAEAGSD